jgi:glutaredoxin
MQDFPRVKDLKSLSLGTLGFVGEITVELKVFTLPSCSSCHLAKVIAAEVAHEFNLAYKEVDLATADGMNEGKARDILSAPTIAVDDEVIVRGGLVSKQRLEEEVRKRMEKWTQRAFKEKV